MAKDFTAAFVEAAKPHKRDGKAVRTEYPDGRVAGLYLIVQPNSKKSWALRYRLGGKTRKHTIGKFPGITLAAARDRARAAIDVKDAGQDPTIERRLAAQAARAAEVEALRGVRNLFENVAIDFINLHAMRKTRDRSWRETARILGLRPDPADPKNLIFAGGYLKEWKGRRVQDITKRDINVLLNGIAGRTPIMANRVLAAVRKLFSWCVSQDILQASPCVAIEPPGKENSRDRVLSDNELRALWLAADEEAYPYGAVAQLLMLTGQRLNEVARMSWSEIDLDKATWVLPAGRSKNKIEHHVPLSEAACSILRATPRIADVPFVFAIDKKPVSAFSRAKDRLAAKMEGEHWTFHDLRRTMATGMAKLNIELPVIEKVLNHTSGTFRGVVGVYQRHSYADEKRAALDRWATHLDGMIHKKPAKVTSLRAAG